VTRNKRGHTTDALYVFISTCRPMQKATRTKSAQKSISLNEVKMNKLKFVDNVDMT